MKQITWRFSEASEKYPELKNRKIKVTKPSDIFENFNFCSKVRLENDL